MEIKKEFGDDWGTRDDKLDSYMAKFMWRSRLNSVDPFEAILSDITLFCPLENLFFIFYFF